MTPIDTTMLKIMTTTRLCANKKACLAKQLQKYAGRSQLLCKEHQQNGYAASSHEKPYHIPWK